MKTSLTRKASTALILLFAASTLAAPNELPDIGNSAGTLITANEEQQIGRMIMRQFRESGRLVTDPEINEYVQSVGHRLSLHSHDGDLKFTFFVIDDPQLNAFALPGGFIGVHSGLLLATANENELAAVLAHEVAHISQKHLVRSAEAAGQSGLVTTAAIVAAVLLGAAGGASGDAISAAIAVAQGSAMQQQINFTRANEYEADRVGISFLNDAGFDPLGMPAFFETMSRRSGLSSANVPEYFRTHPVSSNRIAESRDRALQLPQRRVASSLHYELTKARVAVLQQETAATALELMRTRVGGHPVESPAPEQYGYAFALVRAGYAADAIDILARLQRDDENVIAYQTLLAQAQLAGGADADGLATFEKAIKLFPRNIPLTMAYSSALMEKDQPARAHQLMLDLVNNTRYDEDQIRLLALAASAEGDASNSHYYMSEFHVLRGELFSAIDQLKLALASPDIHDYQLARAEARIEEITKYLPKRRRPRPSEEVDKKRRLSMH